jgi:UDP-N-acetylmuramate: L-alanyl-gamma-D-glutamyl-meso-diaminopimelate ligase
VNITPETGIPEDIAHIHMIAICGTGMGALASMLKTKGYTVTGSDQKVYPPMSDFLQSQGIALCHGYTGDNLSPLPDLVIMGNAVSRDNPEVMAVQSLNLPYCSMPQAINRFAAAGKKQIVVTGTHGKTTTSSFIAWLLHCARLDPSFLIGGILSNFDSNFRVGLGEWIVLEGDEYDTAFFDKGPKFLHYTPTVAVLTSVEFDHADIFDDLAHVKAAFTRFLKGIEAKALLLAFDQDSNVADLIGHAGCRVSNYGVDPHSDWRLGEVRLSAPMTGFEVQLPGGGLWESFETPMIGRHNLFNLIAGIAVGVELGIDTATIGRALSSFRGVRRRQEMRGVKRDIMVIDDFAHHPSAVRETISAVKAFYRDRRVVAIFEPRTNSSRRNIFQNDYVLSFDDADLVCIRQAPMLEKIPPDQRFSSDRLVRDLNHRGKAALYFEDTDALIDHLTANARPGDVLLIMSNGGFDNIHQRLLERL